MFSRTIALQPSFASLVMMFALLCPPRFEAQVIADNRSPAAATSSNAVPTSHTVFITSTHRFWDRPNILLFSGSVVFRALDYTSTRNMQSRGREEILIPDDVVNNSAGFVSLEAAGAAASVGISYLLHRSGHHRLERWLSIGHVGVTGFGAARNYALKSRH